MSRLERAKKRNENIVKRCLNFDEQIVENDEVNRNDISENSLSNAEECITSKCIRNDIGIQVTSGDLVFLFSTLINSDKKLNTLTGLHSFTLLDSIVDSINILKTKPTHSFQLQSTKDCVILTFMKLKQNLSYSVLAILFQCSNSNCKKLITETICLLSVILKPMIPWPTKNEILCNLPKCFKNFESTRIIIDCIEIPIMKPKSLSASIITYSNYKSTYTAKFMTCVTPAGIISFISQGYGGRASDKFIFENSNVIDLLEENDAIMADKGFLIDSLCAKKHVKLFRPPFLRGKQQLTQTEALLNKSIASARVHIERVNQRIKIFNIFSKFPSSLLSKIDEIFLIACAIVNLSVPILNNNKFMTK